MPFAGLIGMNEIWVLPSLQQGSPFLSVPIIPSNEKFALLHVKHKGGSRGVPQLLTTTAKYWLFMPFIPWGITCYHIVWALSTLLSGHRSTELTMYSITDQACLLIWLVWDFMCWHLVTNDGCGCYLAWLTWKERINQFIKYWSSLQRKIGHIFQISSSISSEVLVSINTIIKNNGHWCLRTLLHIFFEINHPTAILHIASLQHWLPLP